MHSYVLHCHAIRFTGTPCQVGHMLQKARVCKRLLQEGVCKDHRADWPPMLVHCCAEESARVHAAQFVPAVEELIVKVMALYEGTTMPASDVRFLPSSA